MKPHSLATRQSKIEFLNALQKRKVSIADLAPLKFEEWKFFEDEPDVYFNVHTGDKITAAELEIISKKRKTFFEVRTYASRRDENHKR